MSVIIKIAPYLQPFAGNKDLVVVHGVTIQDCLNDLMTKYPAMTDWLFDIHGTLKTIIIINGEIIAAKDLDSRVTETDQFKIIMPLGGG